MGRDVLKAPRVPEKVVQAQLVRLLQSIGAAVYVLGTRRPRTDSHFGTRQTPGLADLYVCLPSPRYRPGPPSILWIEVKARGGRLSQEQRTFRARCVECHVPHLVGGIDELVLFLCEGGWLKPENVPHYRRPVVPQEIVG